MVRVFIGAIYAPVTSYTPPLFLYRITIGMTAARNVQHVHYYSERITTEPLQLIVPFASNYSCLAHPRS